MKKKSAIAMLLCSMLLIGTAGTILASVSESTDEAAELELKHEIFLEHQGESLETYFAIKDELLEDNETYGGIFIDANGDLNVMFVNDSKERASNQNTVRMYRNLLEEHSNEEQKIIYREVTYTFNQLKTIQESLLDNAEELGIIGIYIDETLNMIVVEYSDENFDSNKVIDFVGDKNCLTFEKILKIEECATVVRNGTGIKIGSIACGAKLGNTYVFLTAAHCYAENETVLDTNDYTFGKVTKSSYGGKVDVSFIERSSSNYLSTTRFLDLTSYTSGNGYGSPADSAAYVSGGFPVGTFVTKYGKTTGVTSGFIISTAYAYTQDGIKFNNLVRTDCYVDGGDSGGAVKANKVVNGLQYTYCIGIIHAKLKDANGNIIGMVYTDMNNAKAALGFYGYYDTTGK